LTLGSKHCQNCQSGINTCCSLRSVVHSVSVVYPS